MTIIKKIKLTKILIFFSSQVLLLSQGSIFAGPLEFGVGVGYNNDHYNLAEDRLESRGFAAGGIFSKNIAERDESHNCLVDTDRNTQTPSEPETSSLPESPQDFISCNGESSGSRTSLNGINVDFKLNYHFSSLFFLRSGLSVDIAFPVSYQFTQRTLLDLEFLGSGQHSIEEELTLSTSGLGFEVPLLLGMNIIQTDNSSAYIALGAHLSFGGYTEEVSGRRTSSLTQQIANRLAPANGASIPSAANEPEQLLSTAYTPIKNTRNGLSIGIQWLIGFQYNISDSLSIFAEMKFLSSITSGANVTGTSVGNNLVTDSPLLSTGNSTASQSALVTAALRDPPVILNSPDSNPNIINGLDFSYIWWSVGLSYRLGSSDRPAKRKPKRKEAASDE